MWLPNSPNLHPVDYAVWAGLFHRWFINVDTEWGQTVVLQRLVNRAIKIVSGVAGLSASSSSKVDTMNI